MHRVDATLICSSPYSRTPLFSKFLFEIQSLDKEAEFCVLFCDKDQRLGLRAIYFLSLCLTLSKATPQEAPFSKLEMKRSKLFSSAPPEGKHFSVAAPFFLAPLQRRNKCSVNMSWLIF